MLKEFKDYIVEKLNPAQPSIRRDQGETQDAASPKLFNIETAYETVEIYNRGVNLIVDAAASIPFDVGSKIPSIESISGGINFRANKLDKLINFIPNPFMAAEELRRNIYLDLVLTGSAYVYFDGTHIYNLPAKGVKINADEKAFIRSYEYGDEEFDFKEIISIRENSAKSMFRGTSRLDSTAQSKSNIDSMRTFQDNFFKNGTVLGLVLTTEDTLSDRVKTRKLEEWRINYSSKSGGRRPMILDGGMQIKDLGSKDFRELDYKESLNAHIDNIMVALGVPSVLINGGNNANIAPNLRLFYIQTVLPLVLKVTGALERYFGYDLKPATRDVLALQPELREEANYLVSLTNAGIITRNEAREKIRMKNSDNPIADELTLPANIAGSAALPSLDQENI